MKTNSPTRAAVYTRVSSEEQIEGTSLDSQRQQCEAFCSARGWEIVDVYTDEGVSGSKSSRPALDRLMTATRSNAVDVVVVFKTDRFTRSRAHLFTALEELAGLGVALTSVTEPFDTSTTAGDTMAGMLGVFAQTERRLIRERTRAGVNARVRAGGWGGGQKAPFGYRVDGKGRTAHLEVDAREAKVVREAVAMVVDQGLSTLEVANRLNALGLTPRKAPLWSSQNLRNCLKRGQWGGTWTFGKTNAKGSVPEPIRVPVEPVLDVNKAAALKAHLQRTRLVRGAKGVHPLSGRLICTCGQTMTGIARGDRANRRYRCRHGRHEPGRPFCSEPSILGDAMDAAIWAQVVNLLSDPEMLMARAREHLDLLMGAQAVTLDVMADAEEAVGRARRALAQSAAKCMAQDLDDATTAETIAQLRAQLDAAQRHWSMVAAVSEETAAAQQRMVTAQELASVAQERLRHASRDLQAKVFALLDLRARVVANIDGRVEVELTGSVAHHLVLSGVTQPVAPRALASARG